MNSGTYALTFSLINEYNIEFTIKNKQEQTSLKYNRINEIFYFDKQNELSKTILENQFQLKKIIHSALKGKPGTGQTIHFAFIKGFPFVNNQDFSHYIQVDRRNKHLKIKVKKNGTKNTYKIYADGSYSQNTKQASYAGFVEDEKGNRQLYQASTPYKSSNLMELLAISEGLKRLANIEKIQVNTDSRFVIRGLVQWIYFWKLNDWHTAQGKKVKFIKHWQEVDQLTQGKVLEIKWIKAHSGNVNHNLCHQMAKQIAIFKQ